MGKAVISIDVTNRVPVGFNASHSASIKYGDTARFFAEVGNGTNSYFKRLFVPKCGGPREHSVMMLPDQLRYGVSASDINVITILSRMINIQIH